MKPLRFAAIPVLAASLAACVPSPKVPLPEPTPTASAQPRPIPTATIVPPRLSWDRLPVTPGDWSLREGAGFVSASYGEANGEPRFVLRCNLATQQVSLERAGQAAQQIIRTETRTQTLPAAPPAGSAGSSASILPGIDSLLDAMALSRGRFAVESPGLSTLVLPAWAEVTVVVEACR